MSENPYGNQYPQGPAQPAGGLGPMPGDNDTRQAAVPAPPDVQRAWMLWMVSIGIGVLGAIFGLAFTDRDALKQNIIDKGTTLTPDEVSTTVNVSLIVGAVFALIIIGLELFFAFKMRSGRNWARIVLTVLGVLGVLAGLYSIATAFTIGSVLNIISIVVVVAAIVFMYKPAANAYFTRPKY